MNRPPDAPAQETPDLGLTAGDIVALVAQQIEIRGARPTLTSESKEAAERAAGQLLDSLGGWDAAQSPAVVAHANGAEHPPPPPPG
ncbi:hypothetical protein [Cryptosporangium minutisporangium]|uniref:Uncharacterized protein n=1 Tax=Cryptosporangium minutisporangium TaxID=113569 RepID=A0ABP6SVV2_9ACTN